MRRTQPAAVDVRFEGSVYPCRPGETVLDALLRGGAQVPFSCCKGVCLTCLLRLTAGRVPERALRELRPILRERGFFTPCVCEPGEPIAIARPDEAEVFSSAVVTRLERLAPAITRVRLEPATALEYRAGQFVNVRRADGLSRSYSLASVPELDAHLEIHVKRLTGGAMSNWISDELREGSELDIQGPNGACFYVAGDPTRPLLLVGNGSALGALCAIARDALRSGHEGPVWLYHGTRRPAGLYLGPEIEQLSRRHENFRWIPCVSGPDVPDGARAGRAEQVALTEHPVLDGWRVFLCGYPPMVHAARKAAYLSGARLSDILADPFENRELRRWPRT